MTFEYHCIATVPSSNYNSKIPRNADITSASTLLYLSSGIITLCCLSGYTATLNIID